MISIEDFSVVTLDIENSDEDDKDDEEGEDDEDGEGSSSLVPDKGL